MARVKLGPGVELDVLNAEELGRTMQEVLSGFARPAETVWPEDGIPLDASGNGTITVENACPAGYQLGLHRLYLHLDGYSWASPYTNAAGGVEVQRAGVAVDGANLGAGAPLIFTWGSADGIVYTNSQQITVKISGGPASTAALIRLQGSLEPLVIT